VAAARCVLLKSGKNENIEDDDDDESDRPEKDFSDDEEEETREDDVNANGNDDERTEVGKIMETSVTGKLGNKPPTNATTPHNSISLSFFPLSFHSPLSGFGAPKPSVRCDLRKQLSPPSLLALYARLLLANSCKYGSKCCGDGGGAALGSGDNVRPCRKS